MNTSKLFRLVFFGLVFVLFFAMVDVSPAQAQATISVAGSASSIIRIGHTELVGSATFSVASGTTRAGTLEFFLPNITFTETSGISLVASGGLVGATATVLADSGIVILNIPAGAVAGASLTLSGIRISAVGTTFTSLDAQISATGNSIIAGQNAVRVVRDVASGITVTNENNSRLTIVNSVIISGPGTFVVTEQGTRTFSSAVGVSGQTNKTQIIFQVTGIPDGISLTFPGFVVGDSGSTLLTMSGGNETLTSQSTTNRVVYEFNESGSSPLVLDSFSITPTVGAVGQVGTGTAVIQVALGPIGAAVPNAQFPSTAIPRFAEAFIPPSAVIVIPPTLYTLSIPVPAVLDNQLFSITNTDSTAASVTARARRDDGTLVTGISNEATVNVGARQTTVMSLRDLFGLSATASAIASVELTSSNKLAANSIGTIGANRFGIASPPGVALTYLPLDRRTSAENSSITVQNTTDSDVTVQLTVRSSAGNNVDSALRTVRSKGALRESLSSLFPSASMPLDGYVVVLASAAVRAVLINNPTSSPEEVPSLASVVSPLTFPFFAFGGGYNSVLTIVNSSDSASARVTLNAFSPNGTALVGQPVVRTFAPRERQNLDFAALFATSSSVTTGYFSVTVESATNTLFGTIPTVFGRFRITADTFSSVAPLVGDPGTQFYMTPTAESLSTYTGLVVFNPLSTSTSVTIDLFSSAGASLGSTTFSLAGNTSRVQLLRELITQSLTHENGTIRITASANVKVLGFRGTTNLTELIYLRGETIP